MNFEKWMKKRGNNKLNAYAKNPYHVSWIKRLPVWSKVVIPTTLALTAAVVVISVGVLPHLGANGAAVHSKNDNTPAYSSAERPQESKSTHYTPASSQAQTSYNPGETDSGYRSVHAKFPTLNYSSREYTLTDVYGSPIVPQASVGQLLYEGSSKAVSLGDEEIRIYAIKNIDDEVAVALRTRYSNIAYAYFNLDTHFHDIHDFKELLNPYSEMDITSIEHIDYTGVEFEQATVYEYANYKINDIYDILFHDELVSGYIAEDYDYESSTEYFQMTLKVEALGVDSFNAYFFNTGYIVFDMFNQNHIFELGQTTYELIDVYLANYFKA